MTSLRRGVWFGVGLLAVLLGGAVSRAHAVDLLVSSLDTDNVLRYDGTTGAFLGTFASGGGLDDPHGIAFGPDGHLYVVSRQPFGGSVLRYHGTTGAFLDTFVSGGSDRPGETEKPTGIVFGPDGHLYVSSLFPASVLRYDGTTGAFLGTFASGGGLGGFPMFLTFAPALQVVPEPATVILLGLGMAGVVVVVRRKTGV